MATRLKSLAQAIKLEADSKSLPELFEHTYYKTVMATNPPRIPKVDMFSPSSLGKCSREIFYRIHGTEPEPSTTPVLLKGSWTAITDTGTDRHERIQGTLTQMYAQGMDITWIDVGRYIFEKKPEGTSVVERQGMETKLLSTILSARFLCDGIVIIDGKYYLIEIKTMNERKWSKAKQSRDILPQHFTQGVAYSIATGINNILYIYENRNNSQIAVYEKFISPTNKKAVLKKIKDIQEYKKIEKIPPKTTDITKCTYCEYKNKCVIDGYTPPLFEEES